MIENLRKVALFILLIVSCKNREPCEVDAAFKKRFDEEIEYLIASETDTSFLYQSTDKIKVIYFLEGVTGIRSQVYWSDALIYPDHQTLEEDFKKVEELI